MAVDQTHPQYDQNLPKWSLVRACDEGSQAIKAGGVKYLPMPNPDDGSKENKSRYTAYVERASYVNFTGHTKEGMTGMVFKQETRVELAPDIKYMVENANGGGLSLEQMIKDAVSDNLTIGRYGLLSDYPGAPPGLTQSQVAALNLQASILAYPAESIINWRTMMVGGVKKLSVVVLQEPTEKISEDGFSFEELMYHRVLLLKIIEGKLTYVQNVYDENNELIAWETGETEEGEKVVTADIFPRKSDGSLWDEIPFTFIGSVNNDEKPDKAPLYDIAEINISHYRNSADFEESSFMVGQPTPVIAGLTQTWVDDNFKDGIQLGSRGGVMLPEGGSGSLLQADPNQMPSQGMTDKEKQMVSIGASIIEDAVGGEVVDAAKGRMAGKSSKLGNAVANVEKAFIKAIGWAMEFMGATKEPEIEINREFYDATIDPQMVIAQIQLLDRGIIAKQDLRGNLRQAGQIKADRTDEIIDGEAEAIEIL